MNLCVCVCVYIGTCVNIWSWAAVIEIVMMSRTISVISVFYPSNPKSTAIQLLSLIYRSEKTSPRVKIPNYLGIKCKTLNREYRVSQHQSSTNLGRLFVHHLSPRHNLGCRHSDFLSNGWILSFLSNVSKPFQRLFPSTEVPFLCLLASELLLFLQVSAE